MGVFLYNLSKFKCSWEPLSINHLKESEATIGPKQTSKHRNQSLCGEEAVWLLYRGSGVNG